MVVIGFFENAESDSAKAYLDAAVTQENIYFGITTSKRAAKKLKASFDSVILYKAEGQAVLDKDFTAENIESFVLLEQLPLVPKYDMEVCLWNSQFDSEFMY